MAVIIDEIEASVEPDELIGTQQEQPAQAKPEPKLDLAALRLRLRQLARRQERLKAD